MSNNDKINADIFNVAGKETFPGQTAFYKTKDNPCTEMARLYVPDFYIPKGYRYEKLFEQIRDRDNGYIDFILARVTEAQRERVQVFETIGDEYAAYFFGKTPPVFTFSGHLYNVKQNNWRHAFLILYSELLRGTQLQRRYRFATVYYDRMFVVGSLLSLATELAAETQMMSSFTFEMLVKKIDYSDKPQDFNPSKVSREGLLSGYGQSITATGVNAVKVH